MNTLGIRSGYMLMFSIKNVIFHVVLVFCVSQVKKKGHKSYSDKRKVGSGYTKEKRKLLTAVSINHVLFV